MIEKIINKVKGWWKSMFDYNKVITEFGLDSEGNVRCNQIMV